MTHDELQQAASDHLLLHFSKQSVDDLLVLERGEGPYVFDTKGKRYIDALSSLFCAQLGYSYGEEMAAAAAAQLTTLAFNTNWGTAHPASIELAAKLAERRAARHGARLLHQRRLGVGRGGVEARPRALPRDRPAAAHQGDRPRHRLPRRHARRTVVHRCGALQGAVRPPGDRRHPRLQHQHVPWPRWRPGHRPGSVLHHVAGRGRGRDPRRRPRRGRVDHRRARAERRRCPRRPARILAGPARAGRQVRRAADGRRGHLRLRAPGRVDRHRPRRHHPRLGVLGQGADVGLRGDGRCGRRRVGRRADRRARRGLPPRHHLRRPPGRFGDRAQEHGDLRARRHTGERAGLDALPRRDAGHAHRLADRRRRPWRRLLLGDGACQGR